MVVAGRFTTFTLPWLSLGGSGEVIFEGCHAGPFQDAFGTVMGSGWGQAGAPSPLGRVGGQWVQG